MRCWPLAPGKVFLMFLLISAGSSQISGDGNKTGLKRVLHELKRQSDSTGGNYERLHVSQQNRTVQKPCDQGQVRSPPGCKTEDPLCSCVCKTGWYMDGTICQPCTKCENGQVEVNICTARSDAVCGCKPGRYKDCNIKDDICDDFTCLPCTSCMAQNKTTLKNCSESEDTECGDCLPGYSLSANKACQLPPPPPTSSPTLSTQNPMVEPCSLESCPSAAPGFKVEFLSLCIICPLLLGVLIIYCKKRRAKERPTSGSLLSLPQPGLPMLRTPLHHSAPLQGRQLYTIIDVVPVRRWKEFVRSLGLRDSEIEAVELENRQLREQQYEMLKCWRHKQGATMEAIFATLEEMDLAGCVQELRQLLQPNNLPPGP